MLLCAQGLCPAKQVKPRATLFCGYALSHLCKISDAPTATQGYQFYLLSPEAVRLTLRDRNNILVTLRKMEKRNEKKRKGLSGCAAGRLACIVAAISLT